MPITDGAYGEDWVFRYKDLVELVVATACQPPWRREGAAATAWQPRSKPIWFTELGCPAVNKGTNQPNVFHDPKSSESFFPYYSNGRATSSSSTATCRRCSRIGSDPANNPVSDVYARAHGRHGSRPCLGLGRAALAGLS